MGFSWNQAIDHSITWDIMGFCVFPDSFQVGHEQKMGFVSHGESNHTEVSGWMVYREIFREAVEILAPNRIRFPIILKLLGG